MSVPERRERITERGPASAAELVAAVLEDVSMKAIGCGNVVAVPTGFSSFDDLTGGLRPGNLIVLGGRPGVGKTAFALNVAAHAALRAQVPTLVFSLGLSKSEAVSFMLASESDEAEERLRAAFNGFSWQATEVGSKESELKAALLVIDDAPAPTLGDLQAKLDAYLLDERLFPKGSVGQLALMIIDGIREIGPRRRRTEPSERKIAKVMCGLKELAKERPVAILATSALNGNVYRRGDKRPRLSDLDRSGSIEGHADVVLFLHRPADEYVQHDDDGATDLIIAKHRSAQIDSVALTYNGTRLRFEERAT